MHNPRECDCWVEGSLPKRDRIPSGPQGMENFGQRREGKKAFKRELLSVGQCRASVEKAMGDKATERTGTA